MGNDSIILEPVIEGDEGLNHPGTRDWRVWIIQSYWKTRPWSRGVIHSYWNQTLERSGGWGGGGSGGRRVAGGEGHLY